MCVGVVLQAWEPEPIVRERFFDGLLEAVCSSVVSDLSPVSVQTLVEQGFGGAEGRLAQPNKINNLDVTPCAPCGPSV